MREKFTFRLSDSFSTGPKTSTRTGFTGQRGNKALEDHCLNHKMEPLVIGCSPNHCLRQTHFSADGPAKFRAAATNDKNAAHRPPHLCRSIEMAARTDSWRLRYSNPSGL